MLAVAGGSGGVGKTTVALALGRVLADAGRRPLLVDCDRWMPDLSRRAGLAGDPGDRSPERPPGLAAVADGAPLDRHVRGPDTLPGVAVLPPGRPGGEPLGAALAGLDWPGPVVLDCPPGVGRDAVSPLRAADRSLLVATPLARSLTGAARTARLARAVGCSPAGVVLARCQEQPDGTDRFDCPVVTVPPAESPTGEYISLFDGENIMSDDGR